MRYLFGFLVVCALGVVPVVGCGETQPECERAADCDDQNDCTEDTCDPASGTCSHTPSADGTSCECPPGLVLCDRVCIDPNRNRSHCGASSECSGASAGVTCGLEDVCIEGACESR